MPFKPCFSFILTVLIVALQKTDSESLFQIISLYPHRIYKLFFLMSPSLPNFQEHPGFWSYSQPYVNVVLIFKCVSISMFL
jgi:hypothetical protein